MTDGRMRGTRAAASVCLVALVLAGCDGTLTADLSVGAPPDPAVTEVRATLRGLEFETAGGGTKKLEFTAGEAVDLMDFVDGTPLRVFTSETLPEARYTGVRLLFERGSDVSVVGSGGTRFEGRLAQGAYADVDFEVKQDERSSESFVLTLDLRRSLAFNDATDVYTLTPVLRAVGSARAASVGGLVQVDCPTGNTAARNGAVYVFQGRNTVPDDVDGTGVEPYASARIKAVAGGGLRYDLRYLAPGDYTLAASCRADEDAPGTSDDLQFGTRVNLRLDAGAAGQLDVG